MLLLKQKILLRFNLDVDDNLSVFFVIFFDIRCLSIKFTIGEFRINVNPVSTLIGACAFWLVIGWALADSQTSIENFELAKQWVTDKYTWYVMNFISQQEPFGIDTEKTLK